MTWLKTGIEESDYDEIVAEFLTNKFPFWTPIAKTYRCGTLSSDFVFNNLSTGSVSNYSNVFAYD